MRCCDRQDSHDDHCPATDPVPPMGGLARPCHAARRRRGRHRAGRHGGALAVHAQRLATREDETSGSARVLLVGASAASLLGVGFALSLAGRDSGARRVLLIGVAVLTVVLSWTVVNTVYTLRYADLHYRSRAAGIVFGEQDGQERPTYRDFAYVAFTIGMTYQVSDTTVRDRQLRRTVLSHALLSYLFGVVIVGGSVNLIAGLLR